ncbi:MAG: ABC transporter ATP-binding protein [Spirochaetota bacterium]|nr:MAG: ABC transporter ATP-binding protein [Spirochaetota bacterium]
MAEVVLKNVTKKFGAVTAISNMNLKVNSGELFVLLGPTGAGKTTTLRCVAGLERQDEGNIFIEGVNVDKFDPANRDVAFVFQYFSLYPHYTVRENLEFPLKPKHRRLPQNEIEDRVNEVSKILHIDHLLERKSDKLSGGEMQRVTIGRAIVRKPKIFLMDEPLSNLDAKLREELRAELKRLQMDIGATLFFVTHDQVEAMTMADRIAVLNKGKIQQLGIPFEVYNHPKNTFVASFVGSPAINFFSAEIKNSKLEIIKGKFEFNLVKEVMGKLKGFQGNLRIGIRPEDVDVSSKQADGSIQGIVYGIENMGVEKIVTIKVEDNIFKAVCSAGFESEVNAKISIKFNQTMLHFFNQDTGENLL